MGETLKQDGSKCHKDENELYEEVRFLVHGSESKVNEGVEIGNTQRTCWEDEQDQGDGEHGPREWLGVAVGEDSVLKLLSEGDKSEEGERDGKDENAPELCVASHRQAIFESEQCLIERACIGSRVDTEEHPTHGHKEEGDDDGG